MPPSSDPACAIQEVPAPSHSQSSVGPRQRPMRSPNSDAIVVVPHLSSMQSYASYGEKDHASATNGDVEMPLPTVVKLSKKRYIFTWLEDRYDIAYHILKVHWVLFSALLLSGILISSISIGWALRLKTFNIADVDSSDTAAIRLSANLVDVDPSAQQMTLDWNVEYRCDPSDCPDVNIYFDANLLRTDSNSPMIPSNSKPDPVFAVIGSNVLALNNGSDRRPSSLTFRTDVAITNADTRRTLQDYPYDKYSAAVIFFAEEANNNNSVSIAIVKTTGIAVGFNAQLQNISDVDNFGTVVKNVEVTRGPVVRLYALFIVLVIWLVTLTFMATCVVNVFFGKGISSGVLVLPMGTLFAFTQLRSTLPGAPDGFGAIIDFVGLLPCLAILTFCSIFMTAIFLLRNPEVDIPRWVWSEPRRPKKEQQTA